MKKLMILAIVSLMFCTSNVIGTELVELPFTVGVDSEYKEFIVDGGDQYDFYAGGSHGNGVAIFRRASLDGIASELLSIGDEKQQDNESFASIFDKGDMIGAGLSYGSGPIIARWYEDQDDVKQDTYLDGIREGYLGCRLAVDVEVSDEKNTSKLSSNARYGWIHIRINDNDKTVTFLSSGYEEEYDTPIAAGDSPVVPIPVLASILGFGIIGIAAMRKRNKK